MIRTYSWHAMPLVLLWLAGIPLPAQEPPADVDRPALSRPEERVTFNPHVARILHRHCSGCHRPGQSAPFSLLTYDEARRRAPEIVELTGTRQMPPWLPRSGYGRFQEERGLTDVEILTLKRWFEQGTPEGPAEAAPQVPDWPSEWQLGKPDLVIRMTEPYSLAADGRDDYRNFVIPTALDSPRWVRAVEFRPDNERIVHHAFIKVDRTSQSRTRDAEDAGPGFGGMESNAQMPGGHFLTWQPGRVATAMPPGLSWKLEPRADVILQTHLKPSGKTEVLNGSIGLYFTDQAPTNTCFKLMLTSWTIDLPPGERAYAVADDYILPIDAQVLAVLPHAHYLAKRMHGYATLPDGTRRELILIESWDFRWQGDYHYAEPVFLPKGSTLHMRFTYDNSSANPANPNRPPLHVAYGPNSTDEMAELWFQVLPVRPSELPVLARDHNAKMQRVMRSHLDFQLAKNPDDAKARMEMGLVLLSEHKPAEALRQLERAAALDPDNAETRYLLGVLLRSRRRTAEARTEFQRALALNPKHSKAHGNLGLMAMEAGDAASAEHHFREALRLNPDDELARQSLAELLRRKGAAPR